MAADAQHLPDTAQVRLAGRVAHHLNNLLVGMLGNAELAQLDLPHDHPARESVDAFTEGARETAELAQLLLQYSGRASFLLRPTSWAAVLDQALPVLAPALPANIPLTRSGPADSLRFEGDQAHLVQVVRALWSNAVDAMNGPGGRLRVGVRPMAGADVAGLVCHQGRPLHAGAYSALIIEDQGPGMTPEQLPQVMEPFFTTKVQRRGLGLPAVAGTVRAHGGRLCIGPAEGGGTRVLALMPVLPTAP